MKQLKYVFIGMMALCAIIFSSCSKEEGTEPTNPEQGSGGNQERPADITELLCDGSRFIKREYKDFSTSVIGTYSAMTTQREYTFSKNGTGNLTIYTAIKAPAGFSNITKPFTWTITQKKPISVRVNITGGETFQWEDVKIEKNELTCKSEVLSKELTIKGVLQKEDVVSYSVNLTFDRVFDEYERRCILMAPSQITVTTKTGKVTFVTYEYGTSAIQSLLPCWKENNGPFNYYNSNVYAIVNTSTPHKYGFCTIYAMKDKMPFVDKGQMYFYIGNFDPTPGYGLTMIENDKEYTLNN